MSIQELPNPTGKRIETGPKRIGEDDWAGVFIRGDEAYYHAMNILVVLDEGHDLDTINEAQLKSLASLLRSCVE